MHVRYFLQYMSFSLLIVASALAEQRCKRYDKDAHKYAEIIADPNYIFYNDETTCEILDAFLDKLETALKNDDSNQVAELISYPFNWNTADEKTVVKDKAQFKKLYKRIFTEKIKKIALEANVCEVGYRGFMLNNGAIWFYPSTGIVAINQRD